MKKLVIVTAVIFAFVSSHAQEFQVPAGYKFKTHEDFKKYEKDVIAGFKWMMATPVTEQKEKRKEVNSFVVQWIMGTPDVSIFVGEKIVTFMKNADMLMIFMAGWTDYVLETGDKSDYMGNLKGVESVIEFYQKNKENLKKDRDVEKYVQMKENGTLEDYIQSNSSRERP